MSENEINVDHVIRFMREQIADQAQEIAILKATIVALSDKTDKV